jgi:hypothetical protein
MMAMAMVAVRTWYVVWLMESGVWDNTRFTSNVITALRLVSLCPSNQISSHDFRPKT